MSQRLPNYPRVIRIQSSARLVATILALGMLLPKTISAQAPFDTSTVKPASLLRVLAEAADGYRTGERVWVVASYRAPHDIAGAFADPTAAAASAREAGGEYAAFGPYVTPARPTALVGNLVELRAIVRRPDGTLDTSVIDTGRHDALFWSESAIDKFVMPYYTSVYGVERAQELRQELDLSWGFRHILWSILLPQRLTAR